MTNWRQSLPQIQGSYTFDVPLAPYTTLKVGGPADVLVRPAHWDDVALFLKEKPVDLPVFILGAGSNVMVRDGGIFGAVLLLGKGCDGVKVEGEVLSAESGASCGKAARAAREAALTGLEFFGGIPGSVGGALKMNAGAYGTEVADILQSVTVLTDEGVLKTLQPAALKYTYRHSTLPENWLFVSGNFKLKSGDKEHIRSRMREINKNRATSQPLDKPSSGSWFTNPVGVDGQKLNAWRTVDAAGCRGLQVGGAQVSEKHSNFFINTGRATAKDFEVLSEQVASSVKKQSGIF